MNMPTVRTTPCPTLALAGALGLVLTTACSAGEPRADDAEAAAADTATTPSEIVRAPAPRSADAVLFSIEGLEGPEAVKYDAEADVYLVSNFGPSDDPDANDGFIARFAAEDGALQEMRWAVGDADRPLQEPRGMALAGDTLWVADARGVHAFSRADGAQLRFVDLTDLEPGFLNDVTAGPDGGIYVTDTGRSRLLRLDGEGAMIVAEGEAVGNPNGITLDPATGQLLLVPWEGGGYSVRRWDPVSRELTTGARMPGGRFDGVEFLDGVLIVAAQGDSTLVRVGPEGTTGTSFQTVPGRPADIAVDPNRRRVAVPYIALDRVDVFDGPPGSGR